MSRGLRGRGVPASGLMSWRIGPAAAAREDRTLPLSGNELHVLPAVTRAPVSYTHL